MTCCGMAGPGFLYPSRPAPDNDLLQDGSPRVLVSIQASPGQWLAAGWLAQDSCIHPGQPRGPPSLLYNGYQVCFLGKESSCGMVLTIHHLLATRFTWEELFLFLLNACLSCNETALFRHICTTAKSNYWLHHVCLSICPHRTTWLALGGFSRYLIFKYFLKICWEISFIKIWQE